MKSLPPIESLDLAKERAVNPESIARLRELDPEDDRLLGDLISMYLDECAEQIATVGTALTAGNASDLERAAHSVKGGSSNFGARRLVNLAFRVEQAGKRNDLHEARGLLPELIEAFEEVREELSRYR